MFMTAGVRSIRRVFSGLSLVCLAVILGACAHPPTTDSGEPKSWVVENVASKSTAELYADLIKPGVFERSSSKVIDGYTVESGNLIMPDKSVGSLVTVRSVDGGLTAFVEKPGKKGSLVINSKGESRFTPLSPQDYSLPDTLPGDEITKPAKSGATVAAGPYVIDMLIGYSRAAVDLAGGDAHSNALAQVESVNLALRNSLVTNVSMRLIGIQIIDQNYSMIVGTLHDLPELFSGGMQKYEPDLLYGVFAPTPQDTTAGWATNAGRTALGHVSDGWIFRHEIGHNAGGRHCHVPGGSYNYGFQNGRNGTIQCEDETPYYSNPNIRDENGLPRGNPATADMARMWRESAERLSSYAPAFDGERIIVAGIDNYAGGNVIIIREPTSIDQHAGVFAYHADEGPVEWTSGAQPPWSRLTATLLDSSGNPHKVKLRGSKSVATCVTTALNIAQACANGWDMKLVVEYFKSDNPELPSGMYTGEIRLRAVSYAGTWSRPVRVSISISGN